MIKTNEFAEIKAIITVADLKSFLAKEGIEWNGQCSYVYDYDEYECPIWNSGVLRDDKVLECRYGRSYIELILTVKGSYYDKEVIKVVLTPLNFSLSRALHAQDLGCRVFMMPKDLGENWMIYLAKRHKNYLKELSNYYDRKIQSIKKEANEKLEAYKASLEEDTKKKIEYCDYIKKVIDRKGR
jgi:hypothetical protein